MSSFTPVSTGTDWVQNTALVNEIVNAFNERKHAIAEIVYDDYADRVAGDDKHKVDWFLTLQSWMEYNCVGFVNYTIPIAGAAAPTMFTLATWREVAGLNANGFRRATVWEPDPTTPDWTVDPEYAYGTAEVGDIYGPWIIDDLHKGLSALRWTMSHRHATDTNAVSTSGSNYSPRGGFVSPDYPVEFASCDEVRAACEADYDASDWNWSTPPQSFYYAAYRRKVRTDEWWTPYIQLPYIGFAVFRERSEPQLTQIGTSTPLPVLPGVSFDWDLYFFPDAGGVVEPDEVPFSDLDGLDATEHQLLLWDSGADVFAETLDLPAHGVVASEVSGNNTFPLDLGTAMGCPVAADEDVAEGMLFEDAYWILKWNFTYI